MDKSTRRALNIHGTLQGILSELRACRFVERHDDSEGAIDEFMALLNRSTALTEDQKLVQAVIRQLYKPGSPPRGKFNAYVLWLGSDGILSSLGIKDRISVVFDEASERFTRSAGHQRGQIVRDSPAGEPNSGTRGSRRRGRKVETGIGKSGLLRAWQTLENASAQPVSFGGAPSSDITDQSNGVSSPADDDNPPIEVSPPANSPADLTRPQVPPAAPMPAAPMPAMPAAPIPVPPAAPMPAAPMPAMPAMPAAPAAPMPAAPAAPMPAAPVTVDPQTYAAAAKTAPPAAIFPHAGVVMWNWGSQQPPPGSG